MSYNNTMNNIIKKALIDALSTVVYIAAVSSFMFYGKGVFGGGEDTVFAPIIMLTLLVLSAAVTGSLVFGRSVLWYLDGNKKEAILLLIHKLVILLVVFVGALVVLTVS